MRCRIGRHRKRRDGIAIGALPLPPPDGRGDGSRRRPVVEGVLVAMMILMMKAVSLEGDAVEEAHRALEKAAPRVMHALVRGDVQGEDNREEGEREEDRVREGEDEEEELEQREDEGVHRENPLPPAPSRREGGKKSAITFHKAGVE